MLTYILDPHAETPLYEQLYRAIRQDIMNGILESQTRLPSKRQIAAHLKISIATVESAYGQLVAEGYVTAKPKRGYFVQTLTAVPKPTQQLKECEQLCLDLPDSQTAAYDLRTGTVDTASFPFSTWAKLMRATLSEYGGALLQSTQPQGALELREEIRRYLYSFRGISVHTDQIVVGAGSEYLIGLLIQLLGREQTYALEDPGYLKVYQTFRAGGAKVLPLPLDADGLQEKALRDASPDIVYLTPSHHFPLGMVMPVTRRMEILQWAGEQENRYLIEDDYDSEFRYASRPISTLKALDHDDHVIYLNTFAKSLAPSLRIGYMVLPQHLAYRLRTQLGFYSSTVPSFEQYTLAKFMKSGAYERHISRVRNVCRARRDALLYAVAHSPLSYRISLQGGDAGQHLLAQVHNRMQEKTLLESAKREGVLLSGLSQYALSAQSHITPSTVLIGYAGTPPEQMKEVVHCLECAWLH